MSKSEQICRVIGVVLSRRQAYACEFLEQHGQSFGVHFGAHDCEQKAGDVWVREMSGQPRDPWAKGSIVRIPLPERFRGRW